MSDERQKELRRARNRRSYKRRTKGITVIPVPERPEVVEDFLDAKIITDSESHDRRAMGEEISRFHQFMRRQWEFARLAERYVEHRARAAIASTATSVSTTISNIFRTRPIGGK